STSILFQVISAIRLLMPEKKNMPYNRICFILKTFYSHEAQKKLGISFSPDPCSQKPGPLSSYLIT
ncbi:MAG: hypothetical protein CMH78_05295, partial [Nitrospinae bacterium]|nr:hypothetical protein [Nitrospinota bacterium]